jgi:hypothetical protein
MMEIDQAKHVNLCKTALKSAKCPMVFPDWLYMTLYADVALVFKNWMISKPDIELMKVGFFPIFGMKHVILQ